MNKAILIGNLGADPEVRSVNGDSVCNMRIATSETWKDREGKKQERTDWHNVQVWGPQGEACGKFLRKGSKVGVEGKIQTRSYEKDGQKHHATEIRADHVEFLDGKKDSDDRQEDNRGRQDQGRQDDRRDNRGGQRQDSGRRDNGSNRGGGRPDTRGNGRGEEPEFR